MTRKPKNPRVYHEKFFRKKLTASMSRTARRMRALPNVFGTDRDHVKAVSRAHKTKQLLRIMSAGLGLAGLVCLGLFIFKGAGAGKLVWDDPIVRKSVMTFAYKIYGDPAAESGRFFLSKIVFHNDGTGPVRDLSVSYHIPDYISWTTPDSYPEIPAGQTIVQLYYPQLPAEVTQLTSQRNATLETKIRWADKAGDIKEEILRNNIILRGVNEIEYCDLPQNEVAGFYDWFSTAEFAIAMVTPNDPVVKEFVGEITKRTGGTLAGISGHPEELPQFMKAMYDYMCETGMRYTSDEGVPTTLGDIKTMVQTVRMPRDVIITNQGLCIELAILWASAMEYLGCDASIVFVPGHALTVIKAGQQLIPIECTAITPKAVKGLLKVVGLGEDAAVVPFEKAVFMANMELNDVRQRQGDYMIYNVKQYQQRGMQAPELPAIPIDEIKNILGQRTGHTAAAYAHTAGGGTRELNNQVREGYHRWVAPNNLASVDVPKTWVRVENGPMPGMIFSAQDPQTSVAVNIFHYSNLSSPAEAMEVARKAIAQTRGGTVKIASQERKGSMIVYTGTTSHRKDTTAWVGFFAPTQNGVIGMLVGAAKRDFQKNQPLIQEVISSFRVGG
jgi:hypothetical protein